MPTYEYACTKCGHQFEIVQSFSDDALTKCPECKGKLRKVFGSVGIVSVSYTHLTLPTNREV